MTRTCNDPFVFFEQFDVPTVDILLFELFADEFDFMLNLRRLNPCEIDEPNDSPDPGTNFSPTIMSPR